MAIVVQSDVWGMNPFSVVQKCHIIKDKIGYEAQLINAVGNKFAPLTERIRETYLGEWSKIENKSIMKQSDKSSGSYAIRGWTNEDERGLGIEISGHLKGEKEPRVLKIMLSACAVRNSTLWVTLPQQQLYYYASKMWYRRYCPDAIMGMYSPDELYDTADIIDVTQVVTGDSEQDRAGVVTPETSKLIEGLLLQVDAATRNKASAFFDDLLLTQEQAERGIAKLHAIIAKQTAGKSEPEAAKTDYKEKRPSLSGETRDMLEGLLSDDKIKETDITRINAILDSILSFEEDALKLASEVMTSIETAKNG